MSNHLEMTVNVGFRRTEEGELKYEIFHGRASAVSLSRLILNKTFPLSIPIPAEIKAAFDSQQARAEEVAALQADRNRIFDEGRGKDGSDKKTFEEGRALNLESRASQETGRKAAEKEDAKAAAEQEALAEAAKKEAEDAKGAPTPSPEVVEEANKAADVVTIDSTEGS